jgi:hypothetical protein
LAAREAAKKRTQEREKALLGLYQAYWWFDLKKEIWNFSVSYLPWANSNALYISSFVLIWETIVSSVTNWSSSPDRNALSS